MPEAAGDRLVRFLRPDGSEVWGFAEARATYELKGYVVDPDVTARWMDYTAHERESHRLHGIRGDRYWPEPSTFPQWVHPTGSLEPPGGIAWSQPQGTQPPRLSAPLQPVTAPVLQATPQKPVGAVVDGEYVPYGQALKKESD